MHYHKHWSEWALQPTEYCGAQKNLIAMIPQFPSL
jgi:hypothetical protein